MCKLTPSGISSQACAHPYEHHLGWRGLDSASAFLFPKEPFHPAIIRHKASLNVFSSSGSFRQCALKAGRNPKGTCQRGTTSLGCFCGKDNEVERFADLKKRRKHLSVQKLVDIKSKHAAVMNSS